MASSLLAALRNLLMNIALLSRRRRGGGGGGTPVVSSIIATPSSIANAPGATQQLVITTNLGTDVTAQCTFSTSSASIATVDAPTLTGVSPNNLTQGQSSQNITLTGTNFTSAALGQSVVFSPGTGITKNSTTFNSSTSITVNVSVSGSATAGAGTIQVQDTNHGNSQTQVFTVNASVAYHWAWMFQDAGDPISSPPAYAIVVSDPDNDVNPFPYPQTASGKPNWGLYGFSSPDHVRTQDNTLGQLGGRIFQANNGTQATLQIAVPAGTFDINVALGFLGGGDPCYIYIYNNSMTLVASVVNVTNTSNNVINLAGSSVAVGSWSFNTGKSSVVLPAGSLYVKLGSLTAQSLNANLITFEINQTA